MVLLVVILTKVGNLFEKTDFFVLLVFFLLFQAYVTPPR